MASLFLRVQTLLLLDVCPQAKALNKLQSVDEHIAFMVGAFDTTKKKNFTFRIDLLKYTDFLLPCFYIFGLTILQNNFGLQHFHEPIPPEIPTSNYKITLVSLGLNFI